MTMTRLFALAAMLLLAACGNQSTTNHAENGTNIEVSSIHWDEAIAAKQVARVSNGNLIFMR